MGTCGGHRSGWRAARGRLLGSVALLAAVAAVAGCTEEADHTRNAETQFGKVDHVAAVDVTPSSWDRTASIVVTHEDIADTLALSRLVGELAEVAAERGYATYRLELSAADGDGDLLVVDETLAEREDADEVLDTWFAAIGSLQGRTTYAVEAQTASLTVESEGGIVHDVGAARRIGGDASTTWAFLNRDTRFTVTGPVSADDVELFGDVQRDVGSTSLPVGADGWRLDRRFGHVRLDVDLDVPGASGESLTAKAHRAELLPLARAALGALERTGLPRFLSLRESSGEATDVFASWTSTQPPAPGRDPHDRGWDRWLQAVARA